MRFFVLPIFDGVIMDGHPIYWVVDAGGPRLKILDGQNKNKNKNKKQKQKQKQNKTNKQTKIKKSHLLFSFLVRIVLLLHLIGGIYLSKNYYIISLVSFE